MNEKKYKICMSVPLGRRNGTMLLRESNGIVDGWMEVMAQRNGLKGSLSDDGHTSISGSIKTLMNTVQYTASGTICGPNILLNLKTSCGAYYPVSGEELLKND